jgi:hypothetical protein
MCSAPPHPFRVAVENENENHDAMRMNGSERYKYKTQTNENSFSSENHTLESNTSVVEKIQVISSSDLSVTKMNRDVNTQWPIESESEMAGQGLARLKNGRFNKVRELCKIYWFQVQARAKKKLSRLENCVERNVWIMKQKRKKVVQAKREKEK